MRSLRISYASSSSRINRCSTPAIKFYAALGNHDNPNERFYKNFNMDGKRYYSFKRSAIRFFALDSNYMDPQQLEWLKKQLTGVEKSTGK